MIRFLLKIFLFIFLALGILFSFTRLLSLHNERKGFKICDTEENLYTIGQNEHYDFLFMGISHARNFSRHMNHSRVESILDKHFLNIGRGGGKCGPAIEYVYLKYFFSRGNSTDKVIYIPTPPMMFSDYLNKNASTFELEPFRVSFLFQNLFNKGKNKKQQLLYYLRYKYNKAWFNLKPVSSGLSNEHLEKYDSTVVNHGFQLAYPNGLDTIVFNENKQIITKTIELCQKHNTKVIFMMTPSMFGEWPGSDQVFNFLYELKKDYPIEIYDYSEACKDLDLYFDHHHLNSKGITWFTENYLKKIIK